MSRLKAAIVGNGNVVVLVDVIGDFVTLVVIVFLTGSDSTSNKDAVFRCVLASL